MHGLRSYTQGGHKLRFFKGGKAQFVTVGIISTGSVLGSTKEVLVFPWRFLVGGEHEVEPKPLNRTQFI